MPRICAVMRPVSPLRHSGKNRLSTRRPPSTKLLEHSGPKEEFTHLQVAGSTTEDYSRCMFKIAGFTLLLGLIDPDLSAYSVIMLD